MDGVCDSTLPSAQREALNTSNSAINQHLLWKGWWRVLPFPVETTIPSVWILHFQLCFTVAADEDEAVQSLLLCIAHIKQLSQSQ